MPHVVFDRRMNLGDYSKKFRRIFQKEPHLIKIGDVFVNRDGNTALLPCVAIDAVHQRYMIEISTGESRSTIRLYPGTDPEKTGAVKTSMALLARQIMEFYPVLQITKTNLDDHLRAVAPA